MTKVRNDIVIASACLAGKKCRYDGSAKPDQAVIRAAEENRVLLACPEAMAGLKSPRPPAEIRGGDGLDVLEGRAEVYNKEGVCVTKEFVASAQKFFAFVQKNNAKEVWLKAKSPSCGVHEIYDGTFEGKLIPGCGVTCALLKKSGIKVVEIP